MRRGLSLQRLHNRDGCTGVAAELKPAWKTQGVRSPLATGVCLELRCVPGLRAVRFRVSGKGDHPGSIRLIPSALVRFLPIGPDADIDGQRHIERCDTIHQFREIAFYRIDFRLRYFENEFVMHLHDQPAHHAGC